MSAILAWLSAKGSALAIGAAIPIVLVLAKKMIPARLASALAGMLGKQMDKVANMEDPVRRGLYMSLALDLVRIAEYELPDKGKGVERYKMVADKLCAMLPILKGQEDKVEQLIEAAVIAMDAELKKQVPG
jgi:hypothetical protein